MSVGPGQYATDDNGLENMTYLFKNKPGVHNNGVVEDGKHQEHAPTNIVDRMRRDLRHHEIEKPLRRRSYRDTQLASTTGENLSDVEPG